MILSSKLVFEDDTKVLNLPEYFVVLEEKKTVFHVCKVPNGSLTRKLIFSIGCETFNLDSSIEMVDEIVGFDDLLVRMTIAKGHKKKPEKLSIEFDPSDFKRVPKKLNLLSIHRTTKFVYDRLNYPRFGGASAFLPTLLRHTQNNVSSNATLLENVARKCYWLHQITPSSMRSALQDWHAPGSTCAMCKKAQLRPTVEVNKFGVMRFKHKFSTNWLIFLEFAKFPNDIMRVICAKYLQ